MRRCSLGTNRIVFLIPIVLVAMPALAAAAVPSPTFSSCVFPDTISGSAAVTVQVTVQKGESRPMPGSDVQVNILVASGVLTAGQATAASALSDVQGHASVVFDEGISGNGEIRLQVHADGILLCTSDAYRLVGSVPMRPGTWGHLKAIYATSDAYRLVGSVLTRPATWGHLKAIYSGE